MSKRKFRLLCRGAKTTAENFNYRDLSVYDWCILLQHQPQFADKCDVWEYFDGYDWSDLLTEQPQLAEKCYWDKLDLPRRTRCDEASAQ